jgi:DNA-binding NarL/FixJ family response regulator
MVGSAREALAVLDELEPEVAVVDLGLPDLDGVDLIAELRRRRASLPIVVLTIASSEARVLAALRAGACGYLLKEDIATRLAAAIEDAIAGGAPMSNTAAHFVLARVRGEAPAPGPQPPTSRECGLSPRQLEVLALLARGLRYGEVAEQLELSVDTVRSHVRAIYERLQVTSKTEAVLVAMRLGLVSAD